MKTIVCVKQVPEIQLVRATNGQLQLPQGSGQINPFDPYAIEEALRIREAQGGSVIAVTVGGESATTVLREAASLGVDELYHCKDPLFEGSDPQAVARVLAAVVTKIGSCDLVLTGKQAIDEDAAMVGGALAARLNLPQVMFVRKIESLANGRAVVQRTTEDGFDVIETPLPAVMSVVKEINEPRLPSLKGKMQAKKAAITTWTAADLGLSAGVGGDSPTEASRHNPPPPRPSGEVLSGSPDEVAEKLFSKLRDAQVI
jgi:electron transfer flavoprotein beta subunit